MNGTEIDQYLQALIFGGVVARALASSRKVLVGVVQLWLDRHSSERSCNQHSLVAPPPS